jgi:hypothetical protein
LFLAKKRKNNSPPSLLQASGASLRLLYLTLPLFGPTTRLS